MSVLAEYGSLARRIAQATFLLASVVATCLVLGSSLRSRRDEATSVHVNADLRAQLASPASLVVGKLDAPRNLIMFGDYQCPPCRAEWPHVVDRARREPTGLAVHFHNFPLAKLHDMALPAADLSAEAGQQGRIASVHAKLFASRLDAGALAAIRASEGMDARDSQEAREAVMRDYNLGVRLGVSGTPTLFLLSPDGDLTRIASARSLP